MLVNCRFEILIVVIILNMIMKIFLIMGFGMVINKVLILLRIFMNIIMMVLNWIICRFLIWKFINFFLLVIWFGKFVCCG